MRLPARFCLCCVLLFGVARAAAAPPRTEASGTDPRSKANRRFAVGAVEEILRRAGAPLRDGLRGAALALAVVARAKDGHAVVFSLADHDPAFSTRIVPLARMIAPLDVVSLDGATHAPASKP